MAFAAAWAAAWGGPSAVAQPAAETGLKAIEALAAGRGAESADLVRKMMENLSAIDDPARAPLVERLRAAAAEARRRLDASGDGLMQRAEAPLQFLPFFSMWDADRNGTLDASDARQLAERTGFDFPFPMDDDESLWTAMLDLTVSTLVGFDADGDGKLARKEVPALFGGMFAMLDANGDQVLDEADGAGAGAKEHGGEATEPSGGGASPNPFLSNNGPSGGSSDPAARILSEIARGMDDPAVREIVQSVERAVNAALDADGNGVVTEADMEATRERVRGRLREGLGTMVEVADAMEAIRGDLGRDPLDRIRERVREEIRRELGMPPPEDARERFRREMRERGHDLARAGMDAIEDRIADSEIPELVARLIERFDADGNGALDARDAEIWRERVRERAGEMAAGAGERAEEMRARLEERAEAMRRETERALAEARERMEAEREEARRRMEERLAEFEARVEKRLSETLDARFDEIMKRLEERFPAPPPAPAEATPANP